MGSRQGVIGKLTGVKRGTVDPHCSVFRYIKISFIDQCVEVSTSDERNIRLGQFSRRATNFYGMEAIGYGNS